MKMDFEAVSWDVEGEAKELDRSLFEDSKKKKSKRSSKRKLELENESSNSVLDKKKKVNRVVAGKNGEGMLEKKNGGPTTEGSNAAASELMSRKERRNKKWEEKMLKRKLMTEQKTSVSLKKTVVDSELLKSPSGEMKDKNMQLGKKSENDAETKLSMSRSKKRKLKWEQIQDQIQKRKKKKLVEGKSDGLRESDGHSETHTDVGKVSKVQLDKTVGDQSLTSKNTSQINRKERKKLQWKQKLKERKLSQQSNPEKNNDSGVVLGKENVQSKKKRKVDKKSKKSTNETEIKEVESSTVKEELPKTRSEIEVAETDSVKTKKKRKRACKRNKFKGFIKPELMGTKDGSEGREGDPGNTLSPDKSENEKPTGVSTSLTDMSNETKKPRKARKKKNNEKLGNDSSNTPKVTKLNSGGQKVEPKGNKKTALDPKKLKALLSPDSRKKISAESDIVEDETDKTESSSRKKKGENKSKTLLEKNKERLNAARFRYLNEQLYTTTGQEAFKMFKNDKAAFSVYHEGFQGQVEKWPTNPIDVIIEKIQKKPKHLILADFGCGDAKLARSVPSKVHSFDLVALNDHVTVCDMSKVPLQDGIVDIGVFCLSLMGTNLTSYLKEANRVIKHNGTLMVAEVTSRFDNTKGFALNVEKMGFKLKLQDNSNKMFVMLEFKKTANIKDGPLQDIELKPCLYKKR